MSSLRTLVVEHGPDIPGHLLTNGPTRAVASATCLLMLYLAGLAVYRLWFHPLSKVPGPKLWAVIQFPYLYQYNITGTYIHSITDFHRKYGPVVRVAPNVLALDGCVGFPEVLGLRTATADEEFAKHPLTNPPGCEIMVIQAARDDHRRQRRHLGHAFSDAAMYEQEQYMTRYIDQLVNQLQARRDEVVDLAQWLNFTTFDIISDLTWASPFQSLRDGAYHPWVKTVFDGLRGDCFTRLCRHYPALIGQPLVWLFGGSDVERSKWTFDLTFARSRERMALGKEPGGRRDFMTHMMMESRKEEGGGGGMSEMEVVGNSPLLIVAGSETTATALAGFFWFVGTYPRVKERLLHEVHESFASEGEIDMRKTAKLEYLHAVLEETLRLYPPAASVPPRMSPGWREVGGFGVPKGTALSVSLYSTMRNPNHFHDPSSFRPERWLRRPTHPHYDPVFESDNRAMFRPFSAGPRDCLGKNLAYAEMRLIAARLLYRFGGVELIEADEAGWMDRQRNFVVWEKGPLLVRLSPRGEGKKMDTSG